MKAEAAAAAHAGRGPNMRDAEKTPVTKYPGCWLTDSEPLSFDPLALRGKRLELVRAMLRELDYAACVLFDPYNQRYATGSRNMFGYFLRNSTRYIFVPAEGPVILFEYPGSAHVSTVLETIEEARASKLVWSSVLGKDADTSVRFAAEIADLVRTYGGGNRRVGLDRCSHNLAVALEQAGCRAIDCQQDLLHVRRIKTDEEVICLKLSMAASEEAVFALREAIRPGVTEQELFAILYERTIRSGGEFIETRLLSSGPRTNPWFNEASGKKLRAGELVALDTDTIGCFGYYSDFSRSFHCGPGRPSGRQRELYQRAYEQVQHNIAVIKPGMALREVAERAWPIPERFLDRRYPSIIHGTGMHGEAPFIAHKMDYGDFGGEDVIEPNMVLSVESYIGEVGGAEGVKLEDEVVVTETGVELISTFPFEEDLLGRTL
ncbi:MAG: M24 family metallopeptidase [Kiloniellales bacterium]